MGIGLPDRCRYAFPAGMEAALAEDLQRLGLHDLHVALGGKMVPFAGYEMPVQYAPGVMKEHLHTRTAAGLFDVSHMGQVILQPKGSYESVALALETLMPVDVLGVAQGRQRYGIFTNETGGILDDLMSVSYTHLDVYKRQILIFGLHLDLTGAAIASVVSRLVIAAVALLPIIKHHGGFDRPTKAGLLADLPMVFAIAGPAILTQVATPIGQAFVTRMVSGLSLIHILAHYAHALGLPVHNRTVIG